MINQLDMCQLEVDKMFHIHVETHDSKTEEFIQESSNPPAWEISNLGKVTRLRQFDTCFNDLKSFI